MITKRNAIVAVLSACTASLMNKTNARADTLSTDGSADLTMPGSLHLFFDARTLNTITFTDGTRTATISTQEIMDALEATPNTK